MNPSLTADVKTVIDRLPHIISTFPVPDVFYRIAEELKSVFHFDRLSITLICEDKNSAVIEFLYSTYSESHLPAGYVLPLNSSDIGEVLSTANPVFVNDTSKGRCDADALLLKDGICSRVSLPLFYGGAVIGVCCMGSRQASHFPESQVCIWKEIAPFVSVVAESARLARKHMEVELKGLNELLKQRASDRAMQLMESEEKFRKISASANDAIIMLDDDERISYWNAAAEKIFGYSKEEVVGKRLHTLIIPVVFRDRHLEGFKEFQITGQGPVIGKTVELTALRRGGEEFPIELSLSGVQIKGKWNAIGTIRDITERKILNARLLAEIEGRKKVQERLKQMVKELERSNAELQQFAYVASHDLQEPLRMVSSYTQLLGRRYKGKLDADADEFIAFAVDGAARMQMLINDLLEYSRVGTKGKPFEKVNCLNIFDHAVSNLRIAIEESGAVITHDEFPTVMADTLQFTQLFQNLMGNAIKFHGKETPRIHISVAQKEGEWLFSIRDNGIGIDPQYVDRVFVIFQRLHSKAEYPGSGIGLAICKKIVGQHGGLIWVESEPGKGATFHFTIPIVNAV